MSIIWDGKEGWLSLVAHEQVPSGETANEKELYFERFPGLAVERTVYERAAARLLGALATHLQDVA